MKTFFWSAAGILLMAMAPPNYGQDQLKLHLDSEITGTARASIDKGLAWLIEQQNRDGSWGCQKGQPPSVALTSLSILSIMAAGSTIDRGPHKEIVQKGDSHF